MTNINQKKQDDDQKIINSAVSRVAGAVEVAGVAVSATMAIKNEAMDDVEALRTGSNVKAGNHAIKKLQKTQKKF